MDCVPPRNDSSPRGWLACWLLFFVVVLGLQSWHAAYRSDLAGDPDEAAHAVTSLMVRDYLTHGFGTHPLRFAEAYEARMPKVALGHYPPGFYLLAGVWLIPSVSIHSLLLLQAVLVASLALLLSWYMARLLPSCVMAASAGLLLCVCAPMEKIAVLVMSDVLMAIVCLLAAISFASYLERPRAKAALAFGLISTFAILTKGSGWMLVFIPPVAIASTGQWKLLTNRSLWLAPVPVILLAVPWQKFSLRYTAGGMSTLPIPQYFREAAPFYLEAAVDSFGLAVVILLAGSLVISGVALARGVKCGSLEASLWALLLGGLVVALVVPSGTSSRYFIPIVAPIIAFPLLTARRMVRSWMPEQWADGVAIIVVGISLSVGLSHKTITKTAQGFHEVIQQVAQAPGIALVCADARGEGALVADAAFDPGLRSDPQFAMLRASKELSKQGWNGQDYVPTFNDDVALREYLKKRGVRWVLLDDSVTDHRQPHFDQLKRTMQAPDSGWQLLKTLPVASGPESGSMLVFTPKS